MKTATTLQELIDAILLQIEGGVWKTIKNEQQYYLFVAQTGKVTLNLRNTDRQYIITNIASDDSFTDYRYSDHYFCMDFVEMVWTKVKATKRYKECIKSFRAANMSTINSVLELKLKNLRQKQQNIIKQIEQCKKQINNIDC